MQFQIFINIGCNNPIIYIICGILPPIRLGEFSSLPRLLFNWRIFLRRITAVDDVSEQKSKCVPFRAREIGGVRLYDELYALWV